MCFRGDNLGGKAQIYFLLEYPKKIHLLNY